MKGLRIIIPIPNCDFDPTEVSVSWQILHAAGHQIDFATADGNRGFADPLVGVNYLDRPATTILAGGCGE